MGWTNKQLSAFQIAERVSSILSLAGCAFIVITYCSSSSFRKPVRTLIFYASFGNILSNVATLIARDGINAGQDSVLCQLQAFFIQQWLPANALWTLCNALNIYLSFYKRYSVEDLKRLEWRYFLACYGIPFIPSITLICIKTKNGGRIYGPAVIWCAIDNQWQYLRIVCFYGPAWVVIIACCAIYIFLGHEILWKRRALRRSLNEDSHILDPVVNGQQNSIIAAGEVARSTRGRQLSQEHKTQSANEPGPLLNHIEDTEYSRTTSRTTTEINMDAAAWSYLRCSFLFFIALVVTWIPSSINRVYALIHPDATNFGLNFAGCFVLPLQGFWNAIIYISTSLPLCKELWLLYVWSRLR